MGLEAKARVTSSSSVTPRWRSRKSLADRGRTSCPESGREPANATVTTKNGTKTQFTGNGTAGNAQLIANAGGIVEFSGTSGPLGDNKVSAGSIAGAWRRSPACAASGSRTTYS